MLFLHRRPGHSPHSQVWVAGLVLSEGEAALAAGSLSLLWGQSRPWGWAGGWRRCCLGAVCSRAVPLRGETLSGVAALHVSHQDPRLGDEVMGSVTKTRPWGARSTSPGPTVSPALRAGSWLVSSLKPGRPVHGASAPECLSLPAALEQAGVLGQSRPPCPTGAAHAALSPSHLRTHPSRA